MYELFVKSTMEALFLLGVSAIIGVACVVGIVVLVSYLDSKK